MSQTPGPWKALCYDESVYVTAADCHIYSIDGKGQGYHPDTIKDWHANARLIAAAPELLEALIDAKKVLRVHGMPPGLRQQIEQAIAKATGGAQ